MIYFKKKFLNEDNLFNIKLHLKQRISSFILVLVSLATCFFVRGSMEAAMIMII